MSAVLGLHSQCICTALLFCVSRLILNLLSSLNVSSCGISNLLHSDMSYLFSERETFNDNISGWDVSSCEDMSNMFEGSSSFDIDISSWDVSSVTTSKRMFSKATSFNRDLSKWNIESFTTMTKMFMGALTFNQNLCLWKDDFPSDSAIDIFTESGCTYTTMPPFCADDCAVSYAMVIRTLFIFLLTFIPLMCMYPSP